MHFNLPQKPKTYKYICISSRILVGTYVIVCGCMLCASARVHSRRVILKLSLQAKFPMKISRFWGFVSSILRSRSRSFSLFFFLLIYFRILIPHKFIPYFKHFKLDHTNSSGMVMKDSTKSNLNVDKVNPRKNLIICSVIISEQYGELTEIEYISCIR